MRSRKRHQEPAAPDGDAPPEVASDAPSEKDLEPEETDESDVHEFDPDVDDGRWDAFILDDDGEPQPEYGDFWFPD